MEIEISRATLRQAKRAALLALAVFAAALGLRFAITGWPALVARLAPRSITTPGVPTATTTPANTERTIAVTPAPLSSPAATVIAGAQPVAIVLHSANLRAGPGTDYILVGAAQPGDRFPIRGRSGAGDLNSATCLGRMVVANERRHAVAARGKAKRLVMFEDRAGKFAHPRAGNRRAFRRSSLSYMTTAPHGA